MPLVRTPCPKIGLLEFSLKSELVIVSAVGMLRKKIEITIPNANIIRFNLTVS